MKKKHVKLLAAASSLILLIAVLASCKKNNGNTDTPSGTADSGIGENTSGIPGTSEAVTEEVTTAEITSEPVPHTPAAREGWALDGVPAYTKGKFDKKKYSAGQGLNLKTDTVYTHQITGTSAGDYKAYLTELEACGYTREYYNEIDANIFSSWIKDGVRVYTYILTALRTVNVIRDTVSCSIEDFCYELHPAKTEDTVMYAYGINGTGQLLLWHMSDNTWILNDGGTKNVDADKLFSFLCRKTGIDPDGKEKVTISMWYVTHAHEDHLGGATAMINKYHDRINIERIMWNIPDQSVISTSGTVSAQANAQNAVTKYYPDVKYLKCHTGMEIMMGDVKFRVLFTQEDNLPKFVSKEYTDFNNTSTVCMTYFCGTSMFLPGDIKNGSLDTVVAVTYRVPTYTSPIIQVAHHGYNSMKAWYGSTLPLTKYAIFENSKAEGLKSGSGPDVYAALGEKNCFFTDKTWAVTVKNGEISITADS